MTVFFGSDIFLLIAGFILLTVGAEWLVRGSSRLAASLGISSLVIGLTVVAFGTSAPEMAVSTVSGLTGQTNIALGNVVGSNVFNVLCILGISALIAPLTVSRQLIRLDVPLLITASVVVFLLGMDGRIGQLDGLLLFAGIVAYTVFLVVQSRKSSSGTAKPVSTEKKAFPLLWDVFLILAGLGALLLGSKWLVDSATSIARQSGVSDLVIGLTIVAAGTSLPEAATSIVASIRGERDIAVGNVIGSSLFNLLAVLGLAGMVSAGGVPVEPSVLKFDFPVMLAVSVACLPVFFTGQRISRWEGGLFFGYYAAYLVFLVLSALHRPEAAGFSAAMCWFVIPLTVITLAVVTFREIRSRH